MNSSSILACFELAHLYSLELCRFGRYNLDTLVAFSGFTVQIWVALVLFGYNVTDLCTLDCKVSTVMQ